MPVGHLRRGDGEIRPDELVMRIADLFVNGFKYATAEPPRPRLASG